MTTHVIGIDIGTMGTKTGIYDEDGRLVAEAFEESVLHYPRPGWVEQMPEDLYGSVVRTIAGALEAAAIDPATVASLAISGQMAGVSTVDADWGTPTQYDNWLDNRCAPQVERLKSAGAEILSVSGCVPSYNHGPKMLYWKEEQPEIWDRIARFVQPAAYVAGRLAGLKGEDAFIDRTYLNFTTFADTENVRWNTDLLGRFGLDDSKLPRIVEPWDIVGHLTEAAASQTGLRAGMPIAAGCGDQAANVLGAGMVDPGTVFDVSGTASVFSVVIDRFATDQRYGALMTCPHVIPGLYYAMAYVAGGGLNLRWFRDEICGTEKKDWEASGIAPYDALCRLAAEAPAGSDRLVFLPHLGGRNTPNNTDMRGAFIGLNWRHGKGHMFRAMMESIGYEYALYLRSVREIVPGLELVRAMNMGGGAKSPLFRQIKSDILQLPYQGLDRTETGTLGSAIVAGHAVGLFPDLAATARRFAKPQGAPTQPAEGSAEGAADGASGPYPEMARLYADLLDTMAGPFARLARL
ncbi:xylulokinase [Faunimonas pinastri]|uniref:Xylulokinase n=1 Tax=Faunimonas pinastri TaxID=1855383 RepID=A0A1H9ESV0_9HYPH|nr:FGGY family carbohydrate kinase [Faunimonas pinastri]SEQ28719.1 xylulokinase [Faunimonas pinastri]